MADPQKCSPPQRALFAHENLLSKWPTWNIVQALAGALLERKMLSGETVRVMEDARQAALSSRWGEFSPTGIFLPYCRHATAARRWLERTLALQAIPCADG